MPLRFTWLYYVGILGGFGLAHLWWQSSLISFAPLILTWPLFLSWTKDHSFFWLVLSAQTAELFSTTYPGVTTLAILTPYVMRRVFFSRVPIEISWQFLGVLVVSTLSAFLILLLPQLVQDGIAVQPWFLWAAVLGITSLLVFCTSLLWKEYFSPLHA